MDSRPIGARTKGISLPARLAGGKTRTVIVVWTVRIGTTRVERNKGFKKSRGNDSGENGRTAADVDESQPLEEKAIVELLRAQRECRGDNHQQRSSTCCATGRKMTGGQMII